jgi:hypothetical protein
VVVFAPTVVTCDHPLVDVERSMRKFCSLFELSFQVSFARPALGLVAFRLEGAAGTVAPALIVAVVVALWLAPLLSVTVSVTV